MPLPQHIKSSSTADIAWGVGELTTYGILQSDDHGDEEVSADARDEHGKVCIHTIFDTDGDCTLEVLMKTGATPPAIGETVTWAGTKYWCRNRRVTAHNDQYTRLRITLASKPGIQL